MGNLWKCHAATATLFKLQFSADGCSQGSTSVGLTTTGPPTALIVFLDFSQPYYCSAQWFTAFVVLHRAYFYLYVFPWHAHVHEVCAVLQKASASLFLLFDEILLVCHHLYRTLMI